MKVGITRFPGTNCDRDVWKAVEETGHTPEWLWHQDRFNPREYDRIVVPGGFSFGDYLRSGALAARSPVLQSVREAAALGVPVLGICNGFQILTECGLLPGALLTNEHCRFVDEWIDLKVENEAKWAVGSKRSFKLPVAHGQGRFYASQDDLLKLKDQRQIWLSYSSVNPNGSLENIAGIMNEQRNVVALMPHPERAMHEWMGSASGRSFFEA